MSETTVGDFMERLTKSVNEPDSDAVRFISWLNQNRGNLRAALEKLGLDIPEGDGFFGRMKEAVTAKLRETR